MFNLKGIQKIIVIVSIIVFLTSIVLSTIISVNNPNGILAPYKNVVDVFTNTRVEQFNFGKTLNYQESVKIKFANSTVVSNRLTLIVDSPKEITPVGIVYIKNGDELNVKLPKDLTIDLTSGEYIIDSSLNRIYIITGKVLYNQEVVAVVNQSATWQVDSFRVTALNTDDFLTNGNYFRLLSLMKDIQLLPSQLSGLSIGTLNSTIPVSNEETITECDSSLLNILILCSINNFRVENNLKKLEQNEQLNQLTLSHAVWMETNNSTSTVASDGLSYIERCKNAGLGECLTEINIDIKGRDFTSLINNLLNNKDIKSKDISQIGLSISGDYLCILLK
jgi:hypothetical protein